MNRKTTFSAVIPEATSVPLPRVAHGFRQRGHDLEDVADDPVVGHLEDRGLLVPVDRDDRLRRAHAGDVLDRPRDADRYVELGADAPPRLADLVAVRAPAL